MAANMAASDPTRHYSLGYTDAEHELRQQQRVSTGKTCFTFAYWEVVYKCYIGINPGSLHEFSEPGMCSSQVSIRRDISRIVLLPRRRTPAKVTNCGNKVSPRDRFAIQANYYEPFPISWCTGSGSNPGHLPWTPKLLILHIQLK